MSIFSPQRIRINAAKEMSAIFWFHMRIMAVLVCMDCAIFQKSSAWTFTWIFAAFCNVFCLAERFWDIQLRSLVYWHPFCQCFFLVSRLILVTISVIVGVTWVRLGWMLVWMDAESVVQGHVNV